MIIPENVVYKKKYRTNKKLKILYLKKPLYKVINFDPLI